MSIRPLGWSEGLFILPHHFQSAQSFAQHWQRADQDWRQPYGYGVAEVGFQKEALAAYELRIDSLRVRLRDGSLISVPENASIPTLDFANLIQEHGAVYIHLLLPEITPGKSCASRNLKDKECRYLVLDEEVEDELAGGNPQMIAKHRFNVQLAARPTLTPPTGYESLVLMKLKRASSGQALPIVDDDYIPPLLTCDAWEALKTQFLQAITASLASYIKNQADYLKTHGGWSEANQPAIRKAIMQLSAVNTAYPYLNQLAECRGVHPFLAYTELCRLAGHLAMFKENWTAPTLPLYDHDDLGRIFRAVKAELSLTQAEKDRKVQRFPFMGVQEWMEVALDPTWLGGGYGFYVGVHSEIRPENLEIFFSKNFLDWKLGSTRTIRQIYRNAEAGLSLSRVVGIHQHLPALNQMTYFKIDPRGMYWDQAVETRTLALIVNPNFVVAPFVGQNTLAVRDPKNRQRDLKLELFVVEND